MRTIMAQHGLPPERWPAALPRALLAMRATVHRGTGESPARLVLGHEIAPGTAGPRTAVTRESRAADSQLLQARLLERAAAERDAQQAAAAGEQRTPDYAAIKEGDYVRIYLGNSAQGELNPKLRLHLWSEPWRVAALRQGHALVITNAADPNVVKVISAMNCKPTHLPPETRDAYDGLYNATQQAKANEQHKLDVLHKEIDWRYEDDADATATERVEIDEIVDHKGNKVRVRWADGSMTWVLRTVIAADAPDALRDYNARNKRKAKTKANTNAKGKQRVRRR